MSLADRVLGHRVPTTMEVSIREDAAGSFAAGPITPSDHTKAVIRSSWAGVDAQFVWDAYDQLGEVRNSVAKLGRIAGHGRFSVMRVGEDGEPTPKWSQRPSSASMVNAALQSPEGGQRGLIERWFELMKVASFLEVEAVRSNGATARGSNLVGIRLRSAEEVKRESDKNGVTTAVKIRRAPRSMRIDGSVSISETEIDPNLLIGQAWIPHPRFTDMPVSQFWSMRTTIQQAIELQNLITMRIRSRAVMAGIHFFPNGLVDVHLPDSAPDSLKNSHNALAKVAWVLQAGMRANGTEDMTQIVGLLFKGEPADIEAYRFADNGRDQMRADFDDLDRLIERLIVGLDAQRGSVLGRQDQNHFSAWSDDSDELRSNILPELDRLAHMLTTVVLWPEMVAAGVSPTEAAKWVVGYESSQATQQVNMIENMRLGHDAGAVSSEAWADRIGLRVDERMSPEERIRWVGTKVGNPYLALYGLPEAAGIDWEIVANINRRPGPTKENPEDSKSGPGVGEPGSPGDQRSDTPSRDRPVT